MLSYVVLVCGGRDQTNKIMVYEKLNAYRKLLEENRYEFSVLVSGAAPGVDSIALNWARDSQVAFVGIPALWDTHGKGAGPIRNALMSRLPISVCLAFNGGTGTQNMIANCKEKGIPLFYPEVDLP
jgi:hypothetical protein